MINAQTAASVAINTNTVMAPCRLCTSAADSATGWIYSNGDNNDGVGATIRLASGTFLIDGRLPVAGDRVLVAFQSGTAMLMNGIYVCFNSSYLIRAADLQCSAQANKGSCVVIFDGDTNSGSMAIISGSVPATLGVSTGLTFSIFGARNSTTSNREVITADKTLVLTSPQYQFLDPSVANQNVFLPAGLLNSVFYIKNITTGLFTLQVKSFGGALNIGSPLGGTIGAGFFYDGTAWQII